MESFNSTYLKIPARYRYVYNDLLHLLIEHGASLIQDCPTECTDAKSLVLRCWNIFQAACSAYTFLNIKKADFYVKYIIAELHLNSEIDDTADGLDDFATPDELQYITVLPDDITIEINSNNKLALKPNSIQTKHITPGAITFDKLNNSIIGLLYKAFVDGGYVFPSNNTGGGTGGGNNDNPGGGNNPDIVIPKFRIVHVYKKSNIRPTRPGTLEGSYNWSNNTLTPPNGWSISKDILSGNIWSTMRVFYEDGTLSEWSEPALVEFNEVVVPTGVTINIYKQGSRTQGGEDIKPVKPNGGSYDFSTNTFNPPSGWQTNFDGLTGTIWTSFATFYSDNTNNGWCEPFIYTNFDDIFNNLHDQLDEYYQTLLLNAQGDLNTAIENANKKIAEANRLIEDAKAILDGLDESEGDQGITEALAKVKAFADWYDVNAGTITNLSSEINAINGRIDTIGNLINTKTQDVVKYSDIIDLKNKTITELLEDINVATGEYTSLKSKLDAVEAKITTEATKVFNENGANIVRTELNAQLGTWKTTVEQKIEDEIKAAQLEITPDQIITAITNSSGAGASIIAAINADNTSNIKLSADKILLDGQTIANSLSIVDLNINNGAAMFNRDGSGSIAKGGITWSFENGGWVTRLGSNVILDWNNISNVPDFENGETYDDTNIWKAINDKPDYSDIPNDNYITQITKNTITTQYVNALGITANSLTVQAMSALRIDANQITSGTIVADSVKSDWVYSGKIKADQITGGNIDGENITVNTTAAIFNKDGSGSLGNGIISWGDNHYGGITISNGDNLRIWSTNSACGITLENFLQNATVNISNGLSVEDVNGSASMHGDTVIVSNGSVMQMFDHSGVHTLSDVNFKNIIEDTFIPIEVIYDSPIFKFTYKGNDNEIHIGTSAQYWNNFAPEFVSIINVKGNEYLGLNYSELAYACVISLAKEVKKLKEQLDN